MSGLILSDCGSVCPCGGKFKTIFNEIIKAKYPACDRCQKPPMPLRVKKSFPNKDGSVYYGWFRSTLDGEPLNSVMACIELIGQLNKEIMSPDFKIEKYCPKSREKMTVDYLLNEYHEKALERTKLPQQHRKHLSPGGYRKIKTNVKCHLLDYFKPRKVENGEPRPWYIDEINQSTTVLKFYDSYIEHWRARDNATVELKTFLNWVKSEYGYISEVCKFPEIAKAREIDAEEIPDIEIQVKVIENVKNKKYRFMFTMAALLTIRPSELTAYHVGDVDHEKLRIRTGQHFSDGGKGFERVPVAGRKSIKGHEKGGVIYHYIDRWTNEQLKEYTKDRDPNEPLFKGELSKYVSQTTLRKAWRDACDIVEVKVTSYVGTKHASLSDHFTKTGDLGKTQKLSKHSDEKSLKRYAKNKSEDEVISSERFAIKSAVGAEVVREDFSNVISLGNYR